MNITLCGSIAFYDDMIRVKAQLEALGHTVKLPPTEVADEHGTMIPVAKYYELRKAETSPASWIWDRKAEAIKAHFDKVEWADAVLVLNYDKNAVAGYIGANTFLEMGVAFHLGKPLFLLNPIPDMASTEEIRGMKPTVLSGDFSSLRLS